MKNENRDSKSKEKFDWTKNAKEQSDNSGPVKTNIPMTAFNLTNCIIGSGIIAIPFGFREAGFGLGIILLLIVAATSQYTLSLLIQAGQLCDCHSYQDVVRAAFGTQGFVILSALQFLFPFIGMVSYQIIIADQLSRLVVRFTDSADIDEIRTNFWGTRLFISGVVTAGVLLPLSFYKNIALLSKWAVVSVLSTVAIVILFIVRVSGLDLPDTEDAFVFADLEFIQALGIFTAAFICHHSSFVIYNSMLKPTRQRWRETTEVSIVFCLLISLTVGILGYITFTGNVQGDLFENFCSDDDVINAARFLYSIIVAISFPVELIVARDVLERSLFMNHQPTPFYRHVIMTIVIVAATFGLSLTTECLGIVVELNGILIATPISFILPPLLVFKLQKDALGNRETLFVSLVLMFGLFVYVAGIVWTVIEFVDDTVSLECVEGQEADFCLKGAGLSDVMMNQTTAITTIV